MEVWDLLYDFQIIASMSKVGRKKNIIFILFITNILLLVLIFIFLCHNK